MIDPKLNNLPAEANRPQTGGKKTSAEVGSSADAANLERVSSNISLKDTVAANSNLSVGGQGIDTSGVSAGAGAGAGLTQPNAAPGLMPSVVPGSRGTGTTVTGGNLSSGIESGAQGQDYTESDVARRAYQAWCDRGCPIGSPEVDWETAERELRTRRSRGARA